MERRLGLSRKGKGGNCLELVSFSSIESDLFGRCVEEDKNGQHFPLTNAISAPFGGVQP